MVSIIKGINCIYIPTTNIKTAVKWYVNTLGLDLIGPVKENQAQLRIPHGTSIFLIKTPKPTNLNYIEISGTEQSALTLEVYDIHNLFNKMKNNGTFVSHIEDNGSCGLSFYTYDPDGNKLDIWGGWPTK